MQGRKDAKNFLILFAPLRSCAAAAPSGAERRLAWKRSLVQEDGGSAWMGRLRVGCGASAITPPRSRCAPPDPRSRAAPDGASRGSPSASPARRRAPRAPRSCDSASSPEVGSSSSRTGSPVASARAIAIHWRSPPESSGPPATRSTPSRASNAPAPTVSSAPRARASPSTPSGAPRATFAVRVPETIAGSCGTHANGRSAGPTPAPARSRAPYITLPVTERSRPSNARNRLVLPLPVGPTRATISPGAASRLVGGVASSPRVTESARISRRSGTRLGLCARLPSALCTPVSGCHPRGRRGRRRARRAHTLPARRRCGRPPDP